jgi:hypothetical protein
VSGFSNRVITASTAGARLATTVTSKWSSPAALHAHDDRGTVGADLARGETGTGADW